MASDEVRIDAGTVEVLARERLSPLAQAYFEGGSGEWLTLSENIAAWRRISLLPRVLRDVRHVATTSRLFGRDLATPVLVAPTAMHRFAHPRAELETLDGARRARCGMVVSMLSTTSVEDLAAAAPDHDLWVQLYLLKDRSRSRSLVERALSAGFRGVVLSVDGAATPRRSNLPGGFLAPPDDFRFPNVAPNGTGPAADELRDAAENFDPGATFDDLSEVKAWCGAAPLLVKGLLRGDDALRSIESGADGVVVSNHGGRQLDGVAATADALPRVVDTVAGRAPVLVDGGVRTGVDIVRALSLGANAVLVGRPVVWGLGAAGADGVAAVLEDLTVDLARTMAFCGAATVAELDRDLLNR